MTFSEARTFLIAAIKARMPVLLKGAPGIGKSDLIADATAGAGADLLLSHPVVEDPTDSKGMPWIVDGLATFLPFGQLRRAMEATAPLVWFLDDLGQASAAVQAAYMQLLLARKVNGHVLPDCVTFLAATNRRTDRAGVSGILEPVKSRFGSIVELQPTTDEWCLWALDHAIDPRLIAFHRWKKDALSAFQASADLTNSPTPRTWSNVARILTLGLPFNVQHEAIAGAVGDGAAVEFTAWLRLFAELPSIDQILIDPMHVVLPTAPGTLYAVAGAVAHRTTPANFARVAQFVQRLVDNSQAEFGVLLVRDALRRDATISQSAAFVRLATSEIGNLISGNGVQ